VLLEAGVIVNRDEELKLESEETRKRMAAAVSLGLDRCLAARSIRTAPTK
jgi:N-acetylmuramoyl-L-alanine amidase